MAGQKKKITGGDSRMEWLKIDREEVGNRLYLGNRVKNSVTYKKD